MPPLLFALLTLFVLVAHARWSDGDLGVSNNGQTMLNFSLPSNLTSDCHAACISHADCAAWEVRFATPACGAAASCALKSTYGGPGAETYLGARVPCALDLCAASGPVARPGAAPLQPLAFTPARLASVAPAGWLADELAAQAATGQTGQLALFWGPVHDSVWLGGDADGYLHEDAPYFLNGAVPLAALLGNARRADPHNLTGQVAAALGAIIERQNASGWLGPDDTRSGDEYWSRYNVLSAFVQQAEAGIPGAAAQLLPAALRYVVEATRRALEPSGSYQINDWSAARAHDFVLTMHTLIDRFPELEAAGLVPAGVSEATLYDAAAVAHAQALGNGAVWEAYFASPSFPNTTVRENFGMLTHGVNVAQAIKTAGVWWRQQPNETLIASTSGRLRVLDEYHGSPSGVVQADEHLAGKEPQHGTELCGIVEAMYSYEVLGDVLGDALFFDRAERAAYNALPGAMTKDQSAHNYLSQANEVQAVVSDPHIWLTDGDHALVFGLNPNFVCCTANHHQGWPKLAARLHKTTADGGVAVTIWAPGASTLTLPGGGAARIETNTSYPFGDDALVTVTAPVGTPVRLRIPGWATAARVCVGGGGCTAAANGSFFLARQATPVATYAVDFAPEVRVDATYSAGSAAVYRGALLYALAIEENMTVIATGPRGFDDYVVRPLSAWNVALLVDPAAPGASLSFARSGPPGASPFAQVTQALTGRGRLLPDWRLLNNSAATPPPSPVDCAAPGACGDEVDVRLVPFGATLLRIAALPWLRPAA